tara:strand:- start:175 stop:1221 length:1047 start_codon:yes stop_codon:yes gene_type:complete
MAGGLVLCTLLSGPLLFVSSIILSSKADSSPVVPQSFLVVGSLGAAAAATVFLGFLVSATRRACCESRAESAAEQRIGSSVVLTRCARACARACPAIPAAARGSKRRGGGGGATQVALEAGSDALLGDDDDAAHTRRPSLSAPSTLTAFSAHVSSSSDDGVAAGVDKCCARRVCMFPSYPLAAIFALCCILNLPVRGMCHEEHMRAVAGGDARGSPAAFVAVLSAVQFVDVFRAVWLVLVALRLLLREIGPCRVARASSSGSDRRVRHDASNGLACSTLWLFLALAALPAIGVTALSAFVLDADDGASPLSVPRLLPPPARHLTISPASLPSLPSPHNGRLAGVDLPL